MSSRRIEILRMSCRAFIFFLVSSIVTYIFLTIPGINTVPTAAFESALSGTTIKPYITRTLMIILVNGIHSICPESIILIINHLPENSRTVGNLINSLGWNPDRLSYYFIFSGIVFSCFQLLTITMYKLLDFVYDLPKYFLDLAAPLAVLAIPCLFSTINMYYDPLTLLLFPAAFLFILRAQSTLFILTFILATLNKETAIFLVLPALLIREQSHSKIKMKKDFFSLVSIWALIRLSISYYYIDVNGSITEFHLMDNIAFIPMIPVYFWEHYILVALVAVLIKISWAEKPLLLRRIFILMLTLMLPTWLIWGRIPEVRVFYEIYSIAILLAVPTIAEIYEIPIRCKLKQDKQTALSYLFLKR
jgi:hypothetical protein